MTDEPKTPSEPSEYRKMVAIAEANGFKQAPADHPIYSEGVTISFLRAAPKLKPAAKKKPT